MYHSGQNVDTVSYPVYCPSCAQGNYLDYDWETGLGYCQHCGWDKDNTELLNWCGGTDGENDKRRKE